MLRDLNMKRLLVILLLFTAVNATCQTKIQNDTEYKAVNLKVNDAVFLRLKDTAQKYMPRFINALSKNKNQYRFLVKSNFTEDGKHEHMWSQIVLYDAGSFEGIFIDSPFDLKRIKTGDKVKIAKKDVEDWAIFNAKDEKIAGGFSIDCLEKKK